MHAYRALLLTAGLAAWSLLAVGCSGACRSVRVQADAPAPSAASAPAFALHLRDWRPAVAAQPMSGNDNIVVTRLGRTPEQSHQLVRVRDREPVHFHARHDLTVFILHGQGVILLGDREQPCGPGDVIHIPRGQIHAFINTGNEVAVAYTIFSPPYDGQDQVLVAAN